MLCYVMVSIKYDESSCTNYSSNEPAGVNKSSYSWYCRLEYDHYIACVVLDVLGLSLTLLITFYQR